MDDSHVNWKKFQRLKFDRKKAARRLKKAETGAARHASKFLTGRLDSLRQARRRILTWLILVGLVLAGMSVQLFAHQNVVMTSTGKAGGSFVEGAVGSIDTLNPLFASTSAEASVSRLIFSSLYTHDSTGALHTDIATGLTIDDSQKVYTVALRDNVMWHDGQKLTAQDVVFTINLIKNQQVRSPLRVNWVDVQAEAVNDNTVRFILPAVYAAFPQALTFPVLPRHILETVSPGAIRESTFSQSPVGSGPFKFQLLQSTDAVRNMKVVHMVANDAYFRGRPKLDRFELQAYSSESDIIAALKAGALNGASDLSVTSLSEVNTRQYAITSQPLDRGVYLLFNTVNPTLSDRSVRKALQLATDTVEIRKQLGGGVERLDLPFIASQVKSAPLPMADSLNLKKSQKMLDDEGWKIDGGVRKKAGKTLELTITTTKDSEYEKVLDLVVAQWKKLGVSVKTHIVDRRSTSSTFVQDVLQARNFDVLLYELSLGADPDVYAYWHSSQVGAQGYNFASYSNRNADAALASARSRLEPDLRDAKYKSFAEQWLNDVPAIGLYRSVNEYISGKNVRAVQDNTTLVTSADRYVDVLQWTIAKHDVYKTP